MNVQPEKVEFLGNMKLSGQVKFSSDSASAPDVWVFKPNDRNVCFECGYPEFKEVRNRLMKEWFPNGFECFQKYVKEGDIMEYFVIFFDAEEGGARNNCVELAKICGVPPTGNFVVMRKKWVDGEEKTIDMGFLPRDKGNQEGLSNFIKFCEGKLSLEACLPQPRGHQKIDGFSKDSLEGNNNKKSLNNMSSSKELVDKLSKHSLEELSSKLDELSQEECGDLLNSVKYLIADSKKCVPECVPRKMMGTSWWKCLGYNSACGCAEMARLYEPNEIKVEKAPAPKSFLNVKMDISIVCCRNVVGVFPDKYVNDSAPKAVRELYMNYWMEFCKEQGVDAKGGTMMIFGSPEHMLEMYPNGLKNVVIAPLYSEERKHIGDEDCPKFSVTCGHMSVDSEFSKSEGLSKSGLSSKELRDMAVGMAKLDMEEKWVEFSKHRLRDVPMSFADSDSPAVPREKQCVFCGCDWGEYGNNAEPVSEGKCCDDCNRNIILNFRRSDKKKCDRRCPVGECDCKEKNAEAERNNKIVDIIGEQVLSACVKISGIISLDVGMPQDYINKRIPASEVKIVADAVKADGWVKKSLDWCLAKGKVTIAEAVQGLDSFIIGLGYRSEVKQVYLRIAEKYKAEDAENARLQAIAEAELLKVIAEAKPEKKEKPKTAKQLEAEATRLANAEKKKADKAKAEFEAKSAIVQEANRKKAQDKQKAILKAKRANQIKLAEQYQGERKF